VIAGSERFHRNTARSSAGSALTELLVVMGIVVVCIARSPWIKRFEQSNEASSTAAEGLVSYNFVALLNCRPFGRCRLIR